MVKLGLEEGYNYTKSVYNWPGALTAHPVTPLSVKEAK